MFRSGVRFSRLARWAHSCSLYCCAPLLWSGTSTFVHPKGLESGEILLPNYDVVECHASGHAYSEQSCEVFILRY
jgi:hypothetical protein